MGGGRRPSRGGGGTRWLSPVNKDSSSTDLTSRYAHAATKRLRESKGQIYALESAGTKQSKFGTVFFFRSKSSAECHLATATGTTNNLPRRVASRWLPIRVTQRLLPRPQDRHDTNTWTGEENYSITQLIKRLNLMHATVSRIWPARTVGKMVMGIYFYLSWPEIGRTQTCDAGKIPCNKRNYALCG